MHFHVADYITGDPKKPSTWKVDISRASPELRKNLTMALFSLEIAIGYLLIHFAHAYHMKTHYGLSHNYNYFNYVTDRFLVYLTIFFVAATIYFPIRTVRGYWFGHASALSAFLLGGFGYMAIIFAYCEIFGVYYYETTYTIFRDEEWAKSLMLGFGIAIMAFDQYVRYARES